MKVIYKKGNVEEVGNYRPNCTLPALYKLFSTIMYNRRYNRLDQAQSEDQGGLDVLTKRWTILQHTDCRNRNAGSGSAWKRSTRPSKPGNQNEHREEKLKRRREK